MNDLFLDGMTYSGKQYFLPKIFRLEIEKLASIHVYDFLFSIRKTVDPQKGLND